MILYPLFDDIFVSKIERRILRQVDNKAKFLRAEPRAHVFRNCYDGGCEFCPDFNGTAQIFAVCQTCSDTGAKGVSCSFTLAAG